MDFSTLSTLLPAEITFGAMLKFLGILIAACIIAGILFRILFGRRSALNQAVCAGLGILYIYVVTVVVYTFSPGNLQQYLVPLPFVKFSGEYLYIMSFSSTAFPQICSEVLSMVILVLVYHLTDSVLPEGESALTWFVLRFLTVLAAMVVHYVLDLLTASFLPELLISYGPTILLVCLIASVLAGILGKLLGLIITVVNPIFGLLFAFFFSNKFGKQLSKAMLTTAILSALVAILEHFGYCIICISMTALISYIPLLGVLLAVWYFIARKM